MKNYRKLLLAFGIFLIIPWIGTGRAFSSTFEEQKTIEKTFVVDASHQLHIDNRYGKVELSNWDRNQIKVVVTVRTKESSRQRAQEALDRVEIIQSNQQQTIKFETRIEPAHESWWSSLRKGGGASLSIDYEIHLPRHTAIKILNSYGETVIPDRDGKVDLTVRYGSLKAKNLISNSNRLQIAYSNAVIQSLDEGKIDIKYGKLDLGRANRLELDMSYCSGSSIGEVGESLSTSLKYSGNFEVGLGKNIKQANIKGSYSSMQVLPGKDSRLDFEVSVNYGSFKYTNSQVRIRNHSERSRTSSSYTGTWNGGGSGSVSISSSYGSVTMK